MRIFLEAGAGNVLAFIEPHTRPPTSRNPKTPDWLQHISIKPKDRAELLELRAQLKANHADVLGATDQGAFRSLCFFDPKRHRLELACPDPDLRNVIKRRHAGGVAQD